MFLVLGHVQAVKIFPLVILVRIYGDFRVEYSMVRLTKEAKLTNVNFFNC